MEKMTYISALTLALSCSDLSDDAKAKLTQLKASLEKKAGAERKPTAKDKLTESYRQRLVEVVSSATEPMTISDIKKADETFRDMNSQQISGLLKPLVDPDVEGHPLQRTVIKRVMHVMMA